MGGDRTLIDKARVDELRRWAAAGMTDKQMADRLGCHKMTVWAFRQRHNIPAGGKSGPRRGNAHTPAWLAKAPSDAAPALAPASTYTEEHGRTVTVYPARHAEGIAPGPTARPKRTS